MQLALSQIHDTGAQLVAISPQLANQDAEEMIKKNHITFDILHDKSNKLSKQFGLVVVLPPNLRELYTQFGIDLEGANGDNSHELPLPATYIIDTDNTVIFNFVEEDHTLRIEPADIVTALKTIKK